MPIKINKSKVAFAEAKKYIPGGVNSPVRSFRSVGGTPPFIARASGSKLYDIDENEYIDYVGSWGPMILGHAHPEVVRELVEAVERGTSYGAPTLLETEMARLIREAVPSMELVRMVNSGTEATMSALRLARAYTDRPKIVKFAGCYHGHHDSLLVKSGSGAMTLGVPDSPGVPEAIARTTITAPYNNATALAEIFKTQGKEIAAVIIEPVPGNMGLIAPRPGYLEIVRSITEEYGALLIFDEVMSGFRVAHGGAQALYNVTPDITCIGKVIGGGLPVGAYGGLANIMENIAPAGSVYQAGTLSGNPLAMTAGIATLRLLSEDGDFYKKLAAKTASLCDKVAARASEHGLKCQFHQIGSMFTVFFSDKPVYDYESAKRSDTFAFNIFFNAMLEQGIYLAPSQFEAGFVSSAHSEADIEATVAASANAFAKVAEYYRKHYH